MGNTSDGPHVPYCGSPVSHYRKCKDESQTAVARDGDQQEKNGVIKNEQPTTND